MKVLIMVAVAGNGEDLQIVMAANINGVDKISPIMLKLGAADSRTGNPYLVYGDAVADFIGSSKYNASIAVFHLRSGVFDPGWDEPEQKEPESAAPLTIAALRRKLPPTATFFITWLGVIVGNNPHTTHRRVVSQSAHVMASEILDGPQKGTVVRLNWKGVRASEALDVITLEEDGGPFLKIDKIDTIGN